MACGLSTMKALSISGIVLWFATASLLAQTGPAPSINPGGIVNGAILTLTSSSLAPGSIAAILGSNLTDGTVCVAPKCGPSFDSSGKVIPTLAGAQVYFNGIAAPILSTPSSSQLDVQIPVELAGASSATVLVTVNGQTSAPYTVSLAPFSPGIFTVNGSGSGLGEIFHVIDSSPFTPGNPVTSSNPATPGEALAIFSTGLGAVSPQPATGAPASGNPLSATVTTPEVTIAGIPASVSFSGLAPGFVGLYQINAQVPAGVPSGNAVPVTLSIGGVTSNTVTIPVSAPSAGLSLQLVPSTLPFAAYVTGPNPSNQTVIIYNGGTSTLTWTATVTSGSWLNISSTSGTVASLSSAALSISVSIFGLSSGVYTGTIQVAAPGVTGSPQTLTVTLNIAPPPSISLSPSSVTFTAYQGGPNPSPIALSITNAGGGSLQWTATIFSITGGNWLSISPASGNQSQALNVSVNVAGLIPETYIATILVSAPNLPSVTVPVVLNLKPAPMIALSPATLTFVGQVGGANPPSRTVSISNAGGSTLNWNAAIISGAWLGISPTSGTNAGTLTVFVNTSGLAPATYTGSIQIAATGASNSPQTISVTLSVETPPVIGQSGIVNGASFAAGAPVAPGSIISIFGSNVAASALNASSTPLPTALLTTSATINGMPAPLYYVGPTQINAQVPFETPTGLAILVVTANGASSPAVTFPVIAIAPGIFLYGTNRAVAQNPDGSINASNNPAKPGDVIVVYMTGQGAVSNPPPDGAAALGNPLSLTGANTTATIGGANASVSFSGLGPGFVGLLQVNVQIPNVAAGDQPLVVTIGGAASNSALITVASQ